MGTGPDLLKKLPLLYDVAHSLHLDGLYFIDILEGVRCSSLLVLNHPDLGT